MRCVLRRVGVGWEAECVRWRRVTALHCVSSLRFVAARAHCCTLLHVTSPLPSSSLLESYFDPTTSAFDRNLTHSYPEWHPDFKYHGHNPYALLIAAFGSVVTGEGVVPTFEWVMIQFYESWAHMNYNVTARVPRQSPAEYLAAWVPQLLEGWSVDFSSDPAVALPTQRVAQIATTVARPGRGYGGTYNYFDPDNFISLSAMIYSGDEYLQLQA